VESLGPWHEFIQSLRIILSLFPRECFFSQMHQRLITSACKAADFYIITLAK